MDRSRELGRMSALGRAALLAVALGVVACREEYRIGEYVWVTWDGREYPAYVIDQKGRARYRVHFDGYDSRWDEDVTIERVKGRIRGPVAVPPPPDKVARAMGLVPKPSGSAGAPSTYSVGDRVRVRWRDSVYPAMVVALRSGGQLLVHYDGYGSEWDELIADERVVGKR